MKSIIAFVGQVEAAETDLWLDHLRRALPQIHIDGFADLSADQYSSVEIAIVANPDPAQLANFPNLKWIHSVWAGVERLVEELTDASFDIVRLIDPELARTMSEAALAWTLYLHRDMPAYSQLQAQKIWKPLPYEKASQTTVGVLGLGALGSQSALRLKDNGFKVLGWSRNQKSIEDIECLSGDNGFTDILVRSDILIVLLPLTDGTRGLLSRRNLAQMKREAAIINFARGPIIDTDALIDLLEDGSISHAVLDVFDTEPLARSSALWNHLDITVLPHISAPTDIDTAVEIVRFNITRYLETGQMPEVVDRVRGY